MTTVCCIVFVISYHLHRRTAAFLLGNGRPFRSAAGDTRIQGENPAGMARRLWLPGAAAFREYLFDLIGRAWLTLDPHDGQAPFRYVDLDEVILGHQGDGAAIDCLRRDMPDTGPAHGARVAAIGDDRGGGVEDTIG